MRRGFTLIEMITVAVVVAVLALLVIGRLQNERDTLAYYRGVQSIETAANKARNQALQTGNTYELTFDETSQSLTVQAVEKTDTSATIGTSITAKKSTSSSSNDAANTPTSVGSGWTVGEVRKADGSTETNLSIKFYADGTAESKSAELRSGGVPVSLIVKQNGGIEVKRGALTDEEPQEWQAGNIEQRTTQQ